MKTGAAGAGEMGKRYVTLELTRRVYHKISDRGAKHARSRTYRPRRTPGCLDHFPPDQPRVPGLNVPEAQNLESGPPSGDGGSCRRFVISSAPSLDSYQGIMGLQSRETWINVEANGPKVGKINRKSHPRQGTVRTPRSQPENLQSRLWRTDRLSARPAFTGWRPPSSTDR